MFFWNCHLIYPCVFEISKTQTLEQCCGASWGTRSADGSLAWRVCGKPIIRLSLNLSLGLVFGNLSQRCTFMGSTTSRGNAGVLLLLIVGESHITAICEMSKPAGQSNVTQSEQKVHSRVLTYGTWNSCRIRLVHRIRTISLCVCVCARVCVCVCACMRDGPRSLSNIRNEDHNPPNFGGETLTYFNSGYFLNFMNMSRNYERTFHHSMPSAVLFDLNAHGIWATHALKELNASSKSQKWHLAAHLLKELNASW